MDSHDTLEELSSCVRGHRRKYVQGLAVQLRRVKLVSALTVSATGILAVALVLMLGGDLGYCTVISGTSCGALLCCLRISPDQVAERLFAERRTGFWSFFGIVFGFGIPRNISPESCGQWVAFLVPRQIRKKCFEPFLEDLKADRAEKIACTASPCMKRWIEFCFYFRLAVTVVQSLVCYLGDLVAKIAPFIRALFFKGGA